MRSKEMTTPTPSIVWVVGDGRGGVLFCSEHLWIAKDHFQDCVDEPYDLGPYTLTEYVPKRDLAARDAELAAMRLDTTWQDHADHWQKRAIAAEQRAEAAEQELAALKAENSKLRSALEIVHFKREPWQ